MCLLCTQYLFIALSDCGLWMRDSYDRCISPLLNPHLEGNAICSYWDTGIVLFNDPHSLVISYFPGCTLRGERNRSKRERGASYYNLCLVLEVRREEEGRNQKQTILSEEKNVVFCIGHWLQWSKRESGMDLLSIGSIPLKNGIISMSGLDLPFPSLQTLCLFRV